MLWLIMEREVRAEMTKTKPGRRGKRRWSLFREMQSMTKRGGLGTRLSALIPGAPEEGGVAPMELPVEAIQPNRRQPRAMFDDEAAAGAGALPIQEVDPPTRGSFVEPGLGTS